MSLIPPCFPCIRNRRRVIGVITCVFLTMLAKQLSLVNKLDEITVNEIPVYDEPDDIYISKDNDIFNAKDKVSISHEQANLDGINDNASIIKDIKVPNNYSGVSLLDKEGIEENINYHFHINNESEKHPLLNLHKYKYSITSDFCKLYVPDIVIFVHSATWNKDKRILIRNTWGKYSIIKNLTLARLFMIGTPEDEQLQRQIQLEAVLYGDLVQGNFKDSYRNLTYKHIMGYHWILLNCQSAKLFVKVDDDVLVNVFNLAEYISRTSFRSNLLYCDIVKKGLAMREKRDKWYVPRDVYPFDRYPAYCFGMAYLISPDVARILCKASDNTRFYWIDDVYVTGILTLKVGQTLTPMVEGHGYSRMRGYHRRNANKFMFLHGNQLWESLWKATLRLAPDKLKIGSL